MPGAKRHSELWCSLLCGGLLFLALCKPISAQTPYARADSIAAHYFGASLHNLYLLSHQLTEALPTEEEKFRALYTWVVQNIENDQQQYRRTMRIRARYADDSVGLTTWNARLKKKMLSKLMEDRKTLCTGYAYLLSYMAQQVDIRCEMVEGYARSGQGNVGGQGVVNHHWNAVQLDGRWLLCDPTWSSGIVDVWPKRVGEDPYFLLEPRRFVLNHYPVDTPWLLMEKAPSLEQFLNGPIVYHGGQWENMIPHNPGTFVIAQTAGKPVQLQFEQLGAALTETLQWQWVDDYGKVDERTVPVQTLENGLRQVAYTFRKPGTYMVHLRHEGHYLLSYQVEVR